MIGRTISHIIVQPEKSIIKKRKPIRLKEYDYSLEGSYFVTICTKDHEDVLGQIVDSEIRLNQYGEIVQSCWNELPSHYSNILLDEFVIMPNHVHGIIIIINDVVGAGLRPAPTRDKRYPLSEIIRAFKSFSARRINEIRNTLGLSVWQRNYYDHIIRNERSLYKIREYIRTNPEQWTWDKENRLFQGTDGFDRWLIDEVKQEITSQKIL